MADLPGINLLNLKRVTAFGGHLLEAGPRVLSRQGERLAITPKAFDVLLLLVRNPGRVIQKEEFFQTLWPDSAVEESNLTQTIFILRKMLREKESGQSFISTIPGRGYLFVCPVIPVEEPRPVAVNPTRCCRLRPRNEHGWPHAFVSVICLAALSWRRGGFRTGNLRRFPSCSL